MLYVRVPVTQDPQMKINIESFLFLCPQKYIENEKYIFDTFKMCLKTELVSTKQNKLYHMELLKVVNSQFLVSEGEILKSEKIIVLMILPDIKLALPFVALPVYLCR